MTEIAMCALLFAALTFIYVAVATNNKEIVEVASMTAIAVVLMAFLVWFVLHGPTPDYLPPYGSDPREIPHQMKD